MSRRAAIARAGLLAGAFAVGGTRRASAAVGETATNPGAGPFVFCLNTATIRGQKLGLRKELELAAQAGYQAVEPWLDSIEQYARNGGSLRDLRQRVNDLGLSVEDAIGFPEWLADDPVRQAKGMERAKNAMDLVAQLGCKRLALPPAGATDKPLPDLLAAAARYRELLEHGDQVGVVPQIELWGFSKRLNRIGQCADIAIETAHPKACVLLDVFHLYKSGCDFHGVTLLSATSVQVLHMNDYPADPPRDQINDGFRIYPGDGIAPVVDILRALRAMGGPKVLSLELFNRKLWEQDALEVARTGLEKMKAVAGKALNSR
ncbi:MAG: sugar phosphate isomerase/epimerase [Verrucomicrobia bacterium]|nr:sugar phosphate isomerase/epimerase [Verrucomicrobiota bacterium]